VLVSGRWNACNVEFFFFFSRPYPYVPAAIANAPGGRWHTARASNLARKRWMGPRQARGRGAASTETHVGSVTYIISHGYIKGGGLLVINISVPETVSGGGVQW
jgi:hypothetical protein